MRLLILVCFLLAACAPVVIPQVTPGEDLQPYKTMTPLAPPTQATGSVKPVESPLPSPTPFTYTIKAGDTLGGIADKFNVVLDQLLAANPGVNPNAMSVGQTLKIPSNPKNPTGESTPAPAGISIAQTGCHPTADRRLWCFALVHDDLPDPVGDITAQLTLVDSHGQLLGSQVALLPLDILRTGQSLPLSAVFDPDMPSGAHLNVQILTAIQLAAQDPRYLAATIPSTTTKVDWSGLSAQVTGKVMVSTDSRPAGSVWVVAVAYDGTGNVVGVRRWESGTGLQPGQALPFAMILSSVAGEIARVDVAVEARP